LLDAHAERDLEAVSGSQSFLLSVSRLLALEPPRQRQVLRLWFNQQGFMPPSAVILRQIQCDMLNARSDKTPLIEWNGILLRRFRDDLYAISVLNEHDTQQIVPWDFSKPLKIAGFHFPLQATLVKGQGLKEGLQNVTVRFRQGGETCRLPGRGFSHSLKKLFQEWRVPYWERDRVPLLYVADRLIAVVGYFIDEEFCVKIDQSGYVIGWDNQ